MTGLGYEQHQLIWPCPVFCVTVETTVCVGKPITIALPELNYEAATDLA